MLFSFNAGFGAFTGMGADLYAREPVFREVVERAAPVVQEVAGYDVLPSFRQSVPPPSKPDAVLLLGVVQFGQVELWRACGVEPDAILGLCMGEVGAVYAAGGLTLEDAARVLGAFGEAMRHGRAPHALFLTEAEPSAAAALCEDSPVPLAVAGTLARDVVNLLCPARDADAAAAHIEARHPVIHRSEVERASHTPLAPPAAPTVGRYVAGIAPRPTIRPCFLASVGEELPPGTIFEAEHWRHLPDANFHFGETVDAALATGSAVVVQIGANPHTSPFLARATRPPRVVETMTPREPELVTWQRARDRVGQRGAR